MIHAFMRYSFALNSTNMILKKKLVPLEGDEIGRLIAHAVEGIRFCRSGLVRGNRMGAAQHLVEVA